MAKRDRYIIDSDISAVSISIRDARNHTAEEIIEDSRAAYRLDQRMEKIENNKRNKWRII